MSNNNKLRKLAIPNLTLALIMGYALGYVISIVDNIRGSNFIGYLNLDPVKILGGQIWRLVTWVLIPPSDNNLFLVILMMFCLVSFGTTLERAWGTVKFNLYIIGGIVITIISSFLCLLYMCYTFGNGDISTGWNILQIAYLIDIRTGTMWLGFSTYYINILIYLGFAITFPMLEVRLWFILPLKMYWLGILDAGFMIYYFIEGGMTTRFAVAAALINVVIFYFTCLFKGGIGRNKKKRTNGYYGSSNGGNSWSAYSGNPQRGNSQGGNSPSGNSNGGSNANGGHVHMTRPTGIKVHRCSSCGRTDETNPELTFRFCSKCNGSHEYCQDHLFTHLHKY